MRVAEFGYFEQELRRCLIKPPAFRVFRVFRGSLATSLLSLRAKLSNLLVPRNPPARPQILIATLVQSSCSVPSIYSLYSC